MSAAAQYVLTIATRPEGAGVMREVEAFRPATRTGTKLYEAELPAAAQNVELVIDFPTATYAAFLAVVLRNAAAADSTSTWELYVERDDASYTKVATPDATFADPAVVMMDRLATTGSGRRVTGLKIVRKDAGAGACAIGVHALLSA